VDVLKVANVLALIASLEVVKGVAVVVVAKVVTAVLALVAGYKVAEYSLTQSLQAWWKSPPAALVLDWW
jgi:hypothetical protein